MNRTLRENAGALPAGQAWIAVMWAYEAVGIPAGQPAAKWRMPADCGTQVLSCLALNQILIRTVLMGGVRCRLITQGSPPRPDVLPQAQGGVAATRRTWGRGSLG
jgi:hypothetical protein